MEQLGVADKAGHGRLHLVGEAACEPLLPLHRLVELPHGLLHLFRHEVEVLGHRADLVLAPHGRPAGELPGGNGPGGPGQSYQRRGQQPGHRVGRRGAQHRHDGEDPQIGVLLALAHGVEAGDVVGGLEIQGLPGGPHRAGEQEPVLSAAAVHGPGQAGSWLRQDALLGEGIARLGLEEHPVRSGQPQGGPGGAVLEAHLVHGLDDGLLVQVGGQAVDDLQGAPGHAVGGEGRVLLPLQGVLEEAGDQEASSRAEEQGQHRQHTQGHLEPEFHGPTSSR